MTLLRTGIILATILLAALLGRGAAAQAAPDIEAGGAGAITGTHDEPDTPDCAPRKPRRTRSFRRLRDGASRGLTQADLAELVSRKVAMFEGERYHRAPVVASTSENASGVTDGASRAAAGSEHKGSATPRGWLGWTIVVVGGVVAGLIVWWLAWFTQFNRQRKEHAARVASIRTRSRLAKSRGPKVQVVKRGA